MTIVSGQGYRLVHGWQSLPLGKIARFVNGDAYRESEWSRDGAPIIRIQNLNDPAKPFNYWAGSLDDRVVVRPGDLLLAWSGTPGTSFGAHLWRGGLGVLNQHIFRVDVDRSLIEPAFALFAINYQLNAMIAKAHGGVGLRHVTKSEVEGLMISFPPIEEQRRIAALLSDQMAAVERTRKAADEQRKTAKHLAATFLNQTFRSSEVARWSVIKLEQTADLLPSKSVSTDGDREVLAITTACLTESGFDPVGIKVARMKSADIPASTVSAGEVLIARSNTPELVGRAGVYEGSHPGVVATDLTIRVMPRSGLSSEFLGAYLSYLYLSGYWKERAGGASGTMKKITRAQISSETVPIPGEDEQRSISARLRGFMNSIVNVRKCIEAELGYIEALPAGLMRSAFNGEV